MRSLSTKSSLFALAMVGATCLSPVFAAHAQGLVTGTNVDVNGDNIIDSRDANASVNLRGDSANESRARTVDTGKKRFGTTRQVDLRTGTEAEGNRLAGGAGTTTTTTTTTGQGPMTGGTAAGTTTSTVSGSGAVNGIAAGSSLDAAVSNNMRSDRGNLRSDMNRSGTATSGGTNVGVGANSAGSIGAGASASGSTGGSR